ncbi:hypothetical protein BHM03_00025410 [Ensete ventricosum]|uniref:Uncharacterized protein n=1 Tax=Ensete ventricosum TaxID=4639 RepID=A0A445MH69_ENSVE|nr:hypothetical protein BHM03_00025410 [Ensete ventricosum]
MRQGGAAYHGQPPCSTGHPRLCRSQGPLQGGRPAKRRPPAKPLAARCSQGGRLQAARKGLPLAASLAPSRGGDAAHKGGRPLVERLPMGKGSRHLHRGNGDSGDDGAEGGKRG